MNARIDALQCATYQTILACQSNIAVVIPPRDGAVLSQAEGRHRDAKRGFVALTRSDQATALW